MTSFSLPALPLRRRDVLIGGAGAAAGLLLPSFAGAQTKLQVTEGNVAPLPIAIPNFIAGTPSDSEVGVGVTQVITNNLQRSGLFAPIDQAAFIERIVNIDAAPQFQSWKTINAQALVTGRMTRQGDGRLKAEFRLWDVASGQPLTGKQYVTSPDRREGLFRQPRGVRRRNRA
jgi:TolB protein